MSKYKYNSDVIYLCKLPSKDVIEKEFGKIVNDDIVLTKERIKHIEDRRKDDADFIKIHLLQTIKDYDYIIKSKDECVRFIKLFEESNNNILVKLSLNNIEKANSVITGIKINKKELNRLINKNKVIDYKGTK